jgi:hypothetical protein
LVGSAPGLILIQYGPSRLVDPFHLTKPDFESGKLDVGRVVILMLEHLSKQFRLETIDRCDNNKKFSNFFLAKQLTFLTQNKGKSCKIVIITLVFEKKRHFFHRKLSKIAENHDHNIDPRGQFFEEWLGANLGPRCLLS